MGARDGKSYISRLKAHPREVWVAGRKVGDVTTDPVFRRPVAAMAQLYDCQADPALHSTMTYLPDDGDGPAGVSFIIPRTHAELVHRRKAMRVWAEATFGTMGRSPDFLNTVLASLADAPEFFAEVGGKSFDNVQRYYRYCRDNDLFLTHTLVNPPVDRSKSASQQADEYAYLGIVEETKDGLIVRGAKMLATHGPTADEIMVYPLPFSVRPGEEKYALAFGIPTDTKGLRFICREPFDAGDQSEWDHPLGARFEEPDAMAIFDDVLVPWDRVFLHGNVELANTLFARTGLQSHTGHQTAVRGLAKCEFMTALAIALSRSVKTDGFMHVQEQIGECIGYLQLIEGAILMSEQKAEAIWPRHAAAGARAVAGAALSHPALLRAHGAAHPGARRRRHFGEPDRSRSAFRDRRRYPPLLPRRRSRRRSQNPPVETRLGRHRHAIRPAAIAIRALLRRRSGPDGRVAL